MRIQLGRALALAFAVLVVAAAAALAAGAKKGATYAGALVQAKEPITLKVSRNGKSVTAAVPFAPLYCEGGGAGEVQITKPAPIGKRGTFKATIVYEFTPTHTKTDKLYVQGKFSGKSVKGTARSEFGLASPKAAAELKKCDGSTTFSAKAR